MTFTNYIYYIKDVIRNFYLINKFMIIWKNKSWNDIVLDEFERKNHLHILGKTWCWKSKLLYNMIMQDINNNNWVIIIDIHWELAEKVINNVPDYRKKDIVYFFPSNRDTIKNIFDIENVFIEWKILVCNISLGVFWDNVWRSFINILLENIKSTLSSIWNNLSKKTYIYIDEFQKFQNNTMLTLLFDAGNYYENIWIIFAYQYLDQLGDEIYHYKSSQISIRDYILKIISNKVIFNIWKYDCDTMWLENLNLLENDNFIFISWNKSESGNL